MNSWRKIYCLALLLALWGGSVRAETPWLHVEGNKIKDPAGNTVILRGISLIDLGAQEAWYGGVNAVIDRVTNKSDTQGNSPGWYPKILRLTITPPDYDPPRTFTPGSDDYYNSLLRPVVNYCKQKDVYAIIDLHYVDDITKNVSYVDRFWSYMAPKFANDSHVMFEIFNEPINTTASTDDQKWAEVKSYMQRWTNTIRAAAPKNLVLVGSPSWDQILVPTVNSPISGGNIVYVVHTYPSHWKYQWYKDQIATTAAKHPLIMTEWGFSQSNYFEDNATISAYGQPLVNFMEQNGLSWTAWVASTDWGPPMFWSDWRLRVGEGEMGGFVKDTLYLKRNANLPSGSSSSSSTSSSSSSSSSSSGCGSTSSSSSSSSTSSSSSGGCN
ncbi:MAG: glycoside hydrolase family 5 protein [Desulfobacterales bacterium]|nr:glycoside hydrolase family 5 protein [Desulfobacterales bacterium]